MEDRQGRLFLALFLSLGIWLAIQYYFFPPPEKPKEKPVSSEKESEAYENRSPSATPGDSSGQIRNFPISRTNPEAIRSFYIKTDPYLIKLSSLGARIEEFYIKNHLEPDGTELKILKDPTKHTIEFNGESYVAIEISRNKGFDFNPLFHTDSIPESPYNYLNFNCKQSDDSFRVECESLSPDEGYSIQKVYTFFPRENYFLFRWSLKNRTNQGYLVASPRNPAYFRSFGSLGPVIKKREELSDRDLANFFRYFYLDGSFSDYLDGTSTEGFFSNLFGGKKTGDPRFEIQKAQTQDGLDFAGTGSRYFIAVLDPLSHNPDGVLLDNRTGNETGVLMIYDDIHLQPAESLDFTYAAYVGVREPEGMAFRDEELDPRKNKKSPFKGLSEALDKSFNQGITTPFRNGIVWILKKIYIVVPNYGWAIVIFSILFKLVFFPLNQKQAESMKKMQELSPQIQEISEKYSDDPQTKQMKIMELYKKNKVNPMGGCLPMLIQIPIFIALYTAFSDTVDLWESPFLWVDDLSEPDTVFVIPPVLGFSMNFNLLPLIMVGTQIVQTRLTVVSSDPNQKMMMYLMPVIMLYFFWSMPSGVTLYWTMQNILSIIQQIITNRYGKNAKLKTQDPGKTPVKPSSNKRSPISKKRKK